MRILNPSQSISYPNQFANFEVQIQKFDSNKIPLSDKGNMVDSILNSVVDLHAGFVGLDNGNMVHSNLNSNTMNPLACDTVLESPAHEDPTMKIPTLRKWKKLARDIISIDSSMQLTVLTKRKRNQEKASQPELPKKWMQVSKVEEHDISMVEVVQQPRQSKRVS